MFASYFTPTPKGISYNKQGILNIRNQDNKCFIWPILAHIHLNSKHKSRVALYRQFEHELNTEGINFPMTIEFIDRFEQLNLAVSVNVFGFGDKEVHPLRLLKEKNSLHHVNLLLLTNDDDDGNTHYCLITDLSRLLANLTKHRSAVHYCDYNLCRFSINEKKHACHTSPINEINRKHVRSSFIATSKALAPSKGIINVNNPEDN